MARRTKEEALATREGILDAAEEVFFERGVARATLEQVAKAAGVTRGAVYWHFRDKVDLFNAMVERVRLPMENAFYETVDRRDSLEDLEDLLARSLAQVHGDARLRRVYTVLLTKCEHTDDMAGLVEREAAVRESVTGALMRFLARLEKAGRLAPGLDPRLAAMGIYCYIVGLYVDSLRSPGAFAMPGDAAALVRLFFAPLKAGSA